MSLTGRIRGAATWVRSLGGLIMSAQSDTAYSGASYQRKELADWTPVNEPADAELLPELSTLVARSRDLSRNHGIAAAGIQTHVDNIVGTGLRLAADPDYRSLGKTIEWQTEWSRTVEALWRSWADTAKFDVARQMTFADMSQMVVRSVLTGGDVFVLPLWQPDPQSLFSTTFQIIEGDRVSNPDNKENTKNLRCGIEIDDYGKPLGYYFRKVNNDMYWNMPGWFFTGGTWERVPATTSWGRKRVLHMAYRERIDQTRGKPLLAPVIEQFKMFDHYQRSELSSAIVNALVAGIIETPMDQASISALMGGDPNAYLAQKNEWKTKLQAGAMIPLYPGDKLTPFAPSRPNSQYDDFTNTVLRHIAAGMHMPYELLCKDFSETNYSSARASLLEATRFFMGRREWLAKHWASHVYCLWLEEAVAKGLVDAPDFYAKYPLYVRSEWIGPGRGWIDPTKEAQAAIIRMNSGISTLQQECAEQGLDWQDTLEQRAREFRRMEELGILTYLNSQAAAAQLSRAPRGSKGGQSMAGEGEQQGEGYEE